jgi:hypothetical protein
VTLETVDSLNHLGISDAETDHAGWRWSRRHCRTHVALEAGAVTASNPNVLWPVG